MLNAVVVVFASLLSSMIAFKRSSYLLLALLGISTLSWAEPQIPGIRVLEGSSTQSFTLDWTQVSGADRYVLQEQVGSADWSEVPLDNPAVNIHRLYDRLSNDYL
ncbi:hypothetical protein [Motiliproteus sp. MSK22-1]|uniref:hypothetical protein n=1 Tax=Motiliproteus sp. MSK22-1 TaxID=1897630 RepID=UPI000976C63E|nr:hypothetical protein [Motiliproteus sp. MSK22-1]OMH30406.1 hypothetical protein BGP75_18695 [Motiliproteus sp. MSK22-1]